MKKMFAALGMGAMVCCLLAGCADTKTVEKSGTTDHGHDHDGEHSHDDHAGHDHDDDHGHAEHEIVHGPNGGHVFSFDSDDVKGEWNHYNDNNVIRLHILDAAGKEAVPVKANVTFTPLGGSDKTPMELEAEDANDDGKSAKYSRDDKNLTIAITAVGVQVEVKTDEKTYTGKIEAHAPHDH